MTPEVTEASNQSSGSLHLLLRLFTRYHHPGLRYRNLTWRSEVEDGDVEEVTQALRLVQVVDVVVVTRRRGETQQGREHF